ncbi:MAG: hypothetical protein CMJ76_00205 [Planctomycetaceae bacterium]|jgi:hypothetical protein|nr:hypothetical protein [Planctomycetaceae bacterium]|tara:strand:- start:1293 stop:1709 length:417 start_codon:yes stop_codon:yes gene_type:complete
MPKRKIDPDTQAQIDSWEKPIPKGKGPGHPKMREKRPVKRVGRPPGQRAAQLELQEFMYKHPKKVEVVKRLFDGALDNDHKNQAAFMKILMDRMLPVSGFEKMGGKSAIQININTLDVANESNVIEGEAIAEVEESTH